jgi:ADP-ribose pyrophosphatase YjhB (NUDIX family)
MPRRGNIELRENPDDAASQNQEKGLSRPFWSYPPLTNRFCYTAHMEKPFATNYTPRDLLDHDAIAAVIRNDQDNILMFYHKKFEFWTIPVGKAEQGETPYEGMCTELREECGIEVIKATEIVARPYSYPRRGEVVNIILHLYSVEKFEGTPKNNEPEKHPEMRYMPISEIRELPDLSDATMLFLAQSPA